MADATILDLKVKIGNSSMYLNSCPCVVDSPTPIVTWTLPQGINQVRYNVKITAVEGGGLFINGSQTGSNTSFQYPTTNPMTTKFLGLCTVEVAISENSSGGYEYTSGPLMFVFDDNAEVISNQESVVFRWSNSYDAESTWDQLEYNLIVATDPLFAEKDVIFNGMIKPTSKNYTSYGMEIEGLYPFFYWKVRAYDGFDYGPFTVTNGFSISDNTAPIVKIKNITVLNNETRDVIIEVMIDDSPSDIITLEVYYNGGTVGATFQAAFMLDGLINVKPGTYFLTWRSSINEKKIKADDYRIKIVAMDKEGLYGMDTSAMFSMDNSAIGADPGGDGSISNNYIVSGYMATRTEHVAYKEKESAPLTGNITENEIYFDRTNSVRGNISSWKVYRTGDLNKEIGVIQNQTERFGYPPGMEIFQIGGTPQGTDLDASDADFVTDLVHVNSDGLYHELSGEVPYTNFWEYRDGYAKFFVSFTACMEDLCPKCNGKGWNKDELVLDSSVPENYAYRYKRTPCSVCAGHRFVRGEYKQDEETGEYNISYSEYRTAYYVPINRYFSPLRVPELMESAIIRGNIIDPRKNFYLGTQSQGGFSVNPDDIPENSYFQKIAPTIDNTDRYGVYGMYDGYSFRGKMAINVVHTDVKESAPVMGNLKYPPLKIEEDVAPVRGELRSGYKEYVPGITYDEAIFMSGRKVPTHKWEPGLFKIVGSLYREESVTSQGLRIIYLQDSWSTYNTIHWIGPGSVNTMTQIQYCEVFSDGRSGEYKDVITEQSSYNAANSAWLIEPLTWHAYWRTSDQLPYDPTRNYRLRIRQFNLVSNTFSQWVYGDTTFFVADAVTNPANIFFVEYMKFSRKLYIYFRIDDPHYESYNVTRVWYSVDGNKFNQINQEDMSGDFYNLSSVPRGEGEAGRASNEHVIVWNTMSYNLAAGDDYRIRIEVIPTRYVNGFSKPVLDWEKSPNTISDSQKRVVEDIEGSWNQFYYDETLQRIVRLENPFFVPGKLQEFEDAINEIKKENAPLPSTAHGYYSFMENVEFDEDGNPNIISAKINEEIVIDGKTYNVYDWLAYKNDNGESRNNRMAAYGQEMSYYIENANKAKEYIDENYRYVRRKLIDQGYYCNGFKNNDPANGKFVFEVLVYFPDNVDEYGMYAPKYNEQFGEVIYTYEVENLDGTTSPYSIHEYDRTSDIYSRIQLDQLSTFNSADGFPMRDFIIVDGERIASFAGGDTIFDRNTEIVEENQLPPVHDPIPGTNDSGYTPATVDTSAKVTSDTFKIPVAYLPGEQSGDKTIWGETFEGKYSWRVSSYNLFYGRPFEQPMYSVSHAQGVADYMIELNVDCFGDKDISLTNVTGISYIDNFTGIYSSYNAEAIEFKTDPPDEEIASGECYDFNWTPLSKNRNRPIIIVDDKHQRHLWYTNSSTYGEKLVVYAKSKNYNGFADYNTAIPYNNATVAETFKNSDAVFGHTVFKREGVFIMYFVLKTGSEYSIKTASSTDGHVWTVSDTSGITGICYNLFARVEGGLITLYYCCYENGKSIVKRSTSPDGNTFSEPQIYFEGINDISSVFVLTHKDKDIIFYTEANGDSYTIKNSSNGVFPEVNGNSISIIKEGYGYRVYYDLNDKIYTAFWKDYVEKPVLNRWDEYGNAIIGLVNNMPCSESGSKTKLVINKNANSWGYYYCTEDFRNKKMDEILGWIVTGVNAAKVKEFRIESVWLDGSNYSQYGSMSPYPFDYSLLTKELGYM